MLKFRVINIVFICLLALCIAANINYDLPVSADVIVVVLYSVMLFYGCYYIGSNFFINVTRSLKTNEKVIAITFDDGPDAANTPAILKILDEANVEAAFFCIGSKIAGNESVLKQVFTAGHLIGNHSYSHHFWFDMFPLAKMLTDMQMMDAELSRVTGNTPKLFRPPYGVTNPNLKKAIIKGGYIPVGWSVRSMDTVIKDEKKLLNNMINQLKPGAVFLFHDTSMATLAMLPAFIKQAQINGYQIIRADKMLNLQPYA